MEKFRHSNPRKESLAFQELLEEHEDTSYITLLRRLPRELVKKHLEIIESKNLSEAEIVSYLESIFEHRKDALTESHISDKRINSLADNPEEDIFKHLEEDVWRSSDIGHGQTARVKKFEFKKGAEMIPLAVKYLITPTPKTLSASAEHDMLHEVERIQTIENLERDSAYKYINVPHPYFHHQTSEIQCYGMELIDGANLQEILDDTLDEEMTYALKNTLNEINQEDLLLEVDSFLKKMHTYCLHGDIKPRNFMLGLNGKLYLIDFGQSVLINDISDKGMSQYENLCDDEIASTRTVLKLLYKKAR